MRNVIALCMISAAVGGLVAFNAPGILSFNDNGEPAANGAPNDGSPPAQLPKIDLPVFEGLTQDEKVNVAVYEGANQSVVNINTLSVQADPFYHRAVPAAGQGSGIVIDREGHILTNQHVIDDAEEIRVTLADGRTFAAMLVGQDPPTDVAVIKIDAPPETLDPVEFGDSNNLLVGQKVYAIGNPFGLERTLTIGIISSLNRSLRDPRKGRTIKSIIQIDAAINPGNSGGALLDSHGKMIGMNTAIASRTGESAGVGFAIPVNTVARIVPQLIEHGEVIRPGIGITRVYQTGKGLMITALAPDGPAAEAGLQGPQLVIKRVRRGAIIYEYKMIDQSKADLITAVDGKPVRTVDDFLTIIDSKKPGDEVVLDVVRDGKEKKVPVVLSDGE